MATTNANTRDNLSSYLKQHEEKGMLRFVTCGSVDDGKSTLIGRLLHDTKSLTEDQLAALEAESKRHGTQNGEIDFALLVDGLTAEREQGITIDVAYRFFGTSKRKFIAADCPGHEQYTRNMASGASTSDLAIVLVDARKGLLTQSRRHSYIVSLFGIRHVVIAVNKIDLVSYDQRVYDGIVSAYVELASHIGIDRITAIPISALGGDNVSFASDATPWYAGPTLLEHLETVAISKNTRSPGFRLPVQWVCRPNQNFRGFAGTIVGGAIAIGDEVSILPSAQHTRVKTIVTADGELESAIEGQAVIVTLADEVDASRGDIIATAQNRPEVADQFGAHLLWLGANPLLVGRQYWLKIGSRVVGAQVTKIKFKVDVNTWQNLATKHLELNEIAVVHLHLDQPVAFEKYRECRDLGAFILIERQTNATVAAGTLDFALRRAGNIHWQQVDVTKVERARIKHQSACCVWLTGLPGSGKSTIANLAEKKLHALGLHTYILDGDNIRHALNKDLGFTDEDRVENIRRVAEVAKLMVDAGLIVLVAFISPFRAERRLARKMFATNEFVEIFVDTPLDVAEERDIKGLYAKARAGTIKNFTGIDSRYEAPSEAELVLDTRESQPQALAEIVVQYLLGR